MVGRALADSLDENWALLVVLAVPFAEGLEHLGR